MILKFYTRVSWYGTGYLVWVWHPHHVLLTNLLFYHLLTWKIASNHTAEHDDKHTWYKGKTCALMSSFLIEKIIILHGVPHLRSTCTANKSLFFKPCPFGLALRKFALDPFIVIFSLFLKKNTSGGLFLSCSCPSAWFQYSNFFQKKKKKIV